MSFTVVPPPPLPSITSFWNARVLGHSSFNTSRKFPDSPGTSRMSLPVRGVGWGVLQQPSVTQERMFLPLRRPLGHPGSPFSAPAWANKTVTGRKWIFLRKPHIKIKMPERGLRLRV